MIAADNLLSQYRVTGGIDIGARPEFGNLIEIERASEGFDDSFRLARALAAERWSTPPTVRRR
jgi:hypothetical protein